MMLHSPDLDLVEFVEKNILPKYAAFDSAHNIAHVTGVIKRALQMVRTTGADINMVYVVAAYHDLGLTGPRAIHHITGGRILQQDARLKKWFSKEQLNIMKEAVEDHRASASHAPRSIYGKIVAEADRDLSPRNVFLRCIQFGKDHYPELDKEQHWKRLCAHLEEKYSRHGYMKLWIQGSENEKNLSQVREMIDNPVRLREVFEELYALVLNPNRSLAL